MFDTTDKTLIPRVGSGSVVPSFFNMFCKSFTSF